MHVPPSRRAPSAPTQSCPEYWSPRRRPRFPLRRPARPRTRTADRFVPIPHRHPVCRVYPPQETGLTCNSWNGKFHLEMHWWHAAHFALWNRLPLLEEASVVFPHTVRARDGQAQGYTGARWPKMTDRGRDNPFADRPLADLAAAASHHLAELCYRRPSAGPRSSGIGVVLQSAEFMASYPTGTPRETLRPGPGAPSRAGEPPGTRNLEPDV